MKVPEGYVAFVEELPGANTQGKTLEEARADLKEAVTMAVQGVARGGNHTIYVNRKARPASAVPRHREVNDFLARKICDDLQVPRP